MARYERTCLYRIRRESAVIRGPSPLGGLGLPEGIIHMKHTPSHRFRNGIYLLAFFTLLTAGVIVLASAAHVSLEATWGVPGASSPGGPGVGSLHPQPLRNIRATRAQAVEAEVIALRPSGFEPAEITRPAGRVLMAVSDQ